MNKINDEDGSEIDTLLRIKRELDRLNICCDPVALKLYDAIYKNGAVKSAQTSKAIEKFESYIKERGELKVKNAELEGFIDQISRASGFPIAVDKKQVTETICKRIVRVDNKLRKSQEEVKQLVTSNKQLQTENNHLCKELAQCEEGRDENARLYESLKEEIENTRCAFGFHPDSEVDLAGEISRVRDEGRNCFHENTKLISRIGELKNTLKFIKEGCDWEETISGGDKRIGEAIDKILNKSK